MIMKNILFLLFCCSLSAFAQDDLLDEIDQNATVTPVLATFKGLKIVNFESTKMVAQNQLAFVVSHRFGSIKNGFDTFFGLDDAVTDIKFIYGLTDGFQLSASRSSYGKIYDLSAKFGLLQQQTEGMPVTVVGFSSFLVNSGLEEENLPGLEFKHRLGYTMQVLIARKFTENFSAEVAPTVFHDNFIANPEQENTQYAIGIGGRYKITKRFSLNADYGIHLNRAENSPFSNPLSIGVDIETGGHVFQLLFSNAQPMMTNKFLSEATGDWTDGDIFFGFNLSRFF